MQDSVAVLRGFLVVSYFFIFSLFQSCNGCTEPGCCDIWTPFDLCGFDVKNNDGYILVKVSVQCLAQRYSYGDMWGGGKPEDGRCDPVVRCSTPFEMGHSKKDNVEIFLAAYLSTMDLEGRIGKDNSVFSPRPGVAAEFTLGASRQFDNEIPHARGPFRGFLTIETENYYGYHNTDPRKNGYACLDIDVMTETPPIFEVFVPYIDENGNQSECPDIDGGTLDATALADVASSDRVRDGGTNQ